VLWTTSPHGSFVVELELERPGSSRYLPSRVPKLAIPPVPAAAAGGAPTAGGAATAQAGQPGAADPSYYERFKHATYDNIRHATPSEDNQVQWKRWPN
jgi:hypothetical protein